MTDEQELRVRELALLVVGFESGFGEAFEDFLDLGDVVFESAIGEHEAVVEEGSTGSSDEIAQGVVDVALEGCWGVAETERHAEPLEESFRGDERSCSARRSGHRYVMVGVLDVDEGQPLGILAHVEAVFDERDRVRILARARVHLAIVDTHAPLVLHVRFGNQNHRGGPRRVGWCDEVLREELVDVLRDDLFLAEGKSVRGLLDGHLVRQMDHVFHTRRQRRGLGGVHSESMDSSAQHIVDLLLLLTGELRVDVELQLSSFGSCWVVVRHCTVWIARRVGSSETSEEDGEWR